MYLVYTDGACDNRDSKFGAWAFVVLNDSGVLLHEESGVEEQTTSNRMEYLAAIKGMEWIHSMFGRSSAAIYSDSKLLVNTAMKWRHRWKLQSWSRRDGEIKNLDLVKEIDSLCEKNIFAFYWVKGHAGNEWNEYCDEMCSSAMSKYGFNSF